MSIQKCVVANDARRVYKNVDILQMRMSLVLDDHLSNKEKTSSFRMHLHFHIIAGRGSAELQKICAFARLSNWYFLKLVKLLHNYKYQVESIVYKICLSVISVKTCGL